MHSANNGLPTRLFVTSLLQHHISDVITGFLIHGNSRITNSNQNGPFGKSGSIGYTGVYTNNNTRGPCVKFISVDL